MTYFTYEESMSMPGKYLITPIYNKLPLKYTRGSYAILAARVMNLTYANYCRMCRDLYGAEIVGKNSYYPKLMFTKGEKLDSLIKELNKRMGEIING